MHGTALSPFPALGPDALLHREAEWDVLERLRSGESVVLCCPHLARPPKILDWIEHALAEEDYRPLRLDSVVKLLGGEEPDAAAALHEALYLDCRRCRTVTAWIAQHGRELLGRVLLLWGDDASALSRALQRLETLTHLMRDQTPSPLFVVVGWMEPGQAQRGHHINYRPPRLEWAGSARTLESLWRRYAGHRLAWETRGEPGALQALAAEALDIEPLPAADGDLEKLLDRWAATLQLPGEESNWIMSLHGLTRHCGQVAERAAGTPSRAFALGVAWMDECGLVIHPAIGRVFARSAGALPDGFRARCIACRRAPAIRLMAIDLLLEIEDRLRSRAAQDQRWMMSLRDVPPRPNLNGANAWEQVAVEHRRYREDPRIRSYLMPCEEVRSAAEVLSTRDLLRALDEIVEDRRLVNRLGDLALMRNMVMHGHQPGWALLHDLWKAREAAAQIGRVA